MGVMGGSAVVLIAGGVIWGLGVDPFLRPRGERTLIDGVGIMATLAFLPVLGLLLGIGIHAVVDSLRAATGDPGSRLGFFFVLLAGLSAFGIADQAEFILVTVIFAIIAALNLGAWWRFRRARSTAD